LTHDDPLAAPGLARRMACWLYEGILLFASMLIATLVFSVAGQMKSGVDPLRPLLIGFLGIVAAVYFTWFWSHGQTLPMRTWGIRMVDRHGRPLTQLRAFLRFLCSSLWFAPVIAVLQGWPHFTLPQAGVLAAGWIGFWALASRLHPQRQFWHDAMAGTRLVNA
jgi:uncharacterized RDD family membrane protein YckC